MSITINLKNLRKSKKISQNDLAIKTQISPQYLRTIEGQKSKMISFEILERICRALDCTPGDLIQIED